MKSATYQEDQDQASTAKLKAPAMYRGYLSGRPGIQVHTGTWSSDISGRPVKWF
jgi:hypothetical protein